MTKIIGLTGGIGSGKTTIANYFHSLGIPVYIADAESKKITEFPQVVKEIRQTFGSGIFDGDILNRGKLAALVFSDPIKLEQLNAIIHPAVRKHFRSWLAKFTSHPIVIKEAAILFESGSYKDCDQIITVIAPLETRIERVIQRDGVNRKNVLERIKNQWTDAERIANSDFVIQNVNFDEAQHQADEILKKLTIR